MDKITEFKGFVKNNPILLKYIKNETMTWQKFYEIYDMYGDKNEIWDKYLKQEKETTLPTALSLTDIIAWLKTANLDKVEEGISSVQRVIGVLQDLGNNKTTSTSKEYKPRPIYKHFED